VDDKAEDLRGNIDGLEPDEQGNWILRGWACDIADHDRVLEIEVLEDSQIVGVGRADMYRDDVRSAGIGDGYSGFAITLDAPPRRRAGAATLALRLASGGRIVVPETSVPMTTLVGYVDRVSGGLVEGWALDLADRTKSLELEMLIDGQMAQRIFADQPREDLTAKYRARSCGFRWAIPAELADGRPHRIAVRIAQSLVILPSSEADITVSAEDLLTGHGMSRASPAIASQRRYLAHIDEYYRVTRIAIEGVAADCVVYCGHAGNEFAPFLARQFPSAYIGALPSLTTNPLALKKATGTTLCVLHVNAASFTEWCLSGAADRFFFDRIAARQPTILSLEAPDRERGLRGLNVGRAKEWCAYVARVARAEGMEEMLANTLIDYFSGHPGFVFRLMAPAVPNVASARAA
jgi:hypothetical protein